MKVSRTIMCIWGSAGWWLLMLVHGVVVESLLSVVLA